MNQISGYVNKFKQLGQTIPSIKEAQVISKLENSQYILSVILGKRNIVENTTHNYQDLYLIQPNKFQLLNSGRQNVTYQYISYSQDKKLQVKQQKLGPENKKNIIEIYQDQALMQSIDVSKIHEDILNDEIVGAPFVWNKDSTKFLYVAKLKKPDQVNFFQAEKDSDVDLAYQNYSYKQSQGERMETITETGLFLYDIQENKVNQIAIQNDLFVTFPQFIENDKIIFGAYKIQPEFNYGILHCFNRRSAIYEIEKIVFDVKKENNDSGNQQQLQQKELSTLIQLSNQDISLKPQVSPDFKKLVYFCSEYKHQHVIYLSLVLVDLVTKESSVLIEIEQDNPTLNIRDDQNKRNKLIHGICGYYHELLKTYWTKDSQHFIYPSKVAAQQGIYAIKINNKKIIKLSHQEDLQYATNNFIINYDRENDILLSTTNSVSQPPYLIAEFNVSQYLSGELNQMGRAVQQKPKCLNGFKESYVYSNDSEGYVWKVENEELQNKKRPLIVIVHGGPHGTTSSNYYILEHILLEEGFILLCPNFSGSASYGQKYIEKLSGQIGILDSKEIIDMLEQVKKSEQIDERNIFVMGASYGGYMSILMASQYHQYFNSAIILNPATNIPFMVNITDIPDWVGSCILNKEFSWNLTPDDYKKLYEMSANREPMKIPSLLLLGAKDLRCPYQQSLSLRAQTIFNGVEIQTYVYPESNHGLSESVNTTFDVDVKIVLFIKNHMKN